MRQPREETWSTRRGTRRWASIRVITSGAQVNGDDVFCFGVSVYIYVHICIQKM